MAIRQTKAGILVRGDIVSTSTSTGDRLTFGTTSTASPKSVVMRSPISGKWQFRDVSDKVLKNAIYNHLRFLRARGETQISLESIARALDIPASDVRRLAPSLKGVKVA